MLPFIQEERQGINWLENREVRVRALLIELQRESIQRRLALRRRVAQECPDLLSDTVLDAFQSEMMGVTSAATSEA